MISSAAFVHEKRDAYKHPVASSSLTLSHSFGIPSTPTKAVTIPQTMAQFVSQSPPISTVLSNASLKFLKLRQALQIQNGTVSCADTPAPFPTSLSSSEPYLGHRPPRDLPRFLKPLLAVVRGFSSAGEVEKEATEDRPYLVITVWVKLVVFDRFHGHGGGGAEDRFRAGGAGDLRGGAGETEDDLAVVLRAT